MKKIILLIFLFVYIGSGASIVERTHVPEANRVPMAVSSEYSPLVVEGRCWWYTSFRVPPFQGAEYGISIGPEIEFDGAKWHEVRLCRSAKFIGTGDVTDVNEEDELLAYIREEDRKVYTRIKKWGYPPLNECHSWLFFERLFDEPQDFYSETLIYDFAAVGDSFTFGYEDSYINFVIEGSKTVEIESGTTIERKARFINSSDEISLPREDMVFTEGIGVTQPFQSTMIFCFPYCMPTTSITSFGMPELRYVTDGLDYEVIYTGKGGEKLWMRTGAADDIRVDNPEGECEWYTVSGCRIKSPDAPGIYVRKRAGEKPSKVCVRRL